MKARLNITIDTTLLAKVKDYAVSQGISVSQLVEDYFKTIALERTKPSLLDVLKTMSKSETEYPENFDFKRAYHEDRKKKFDL